jgi:beta-lactamase class A
VSLLGSTPEGIELAARVESEFADAGAGGSFLARNVHTGEEIGFGVDRMIPLASVAKVPVALVAYDRIADGVVDPSHPVTIDPRYSTPGPTGTAVFRHPATIALEDLLLLMLSISDNAAADAVIDLIGLDVIRERLDAWGCAGLAMRHRMRALYDSVEMLANDDIWLALELAVRGTGDGSHPLPVLDVTEANSGSARGLVGLLERIWLDRISTPEVTAELRRLLGYQVMRHRLAGELNVDGIRVSSKTGTFLNLRHETGVVETDTGDVIAIAALTVSSVAAFTQPEIDWAIGSAARRAVELLRD